MVTAGLMAPAHANAARAITETLLRSLSPEMPGAKSGVRFDVDSLRQHVREHPFLADALEHLLTDEEIDQLLRDAE